MADKPNKPELICKSYDELVKDIPELKGFQLREKTKQNVQEFFEHIIAYCFKNKLMYLATDSGFYVFAKVSDQTSEEEEQNGKSKKK